MGIVTRREWARTGGEGLCSLIVYGYGFGIENLKGVAFNLGGTWAARAM